MRRYFRVSKLAVQKAALIITRLAATSRTTRYSSTLFTPHDEGDLIFTGLAGRIDRSIFSNGVQFDASWAINDCNILRGGFLVTAEIARVSTNNQVFPVDAAGNQTSDVPFTVISNQRKTGAYYVGYSS
jgi:hypothetical protein